MVVVLLSRPVKNAIQTALDRVYYRDRYDYRRALVGFARDLNSDLDLFRLSERLVHRVTETLRRRSHGADAGAGRAPGATASSSPSRTSGSPASRRRCRARPTSATRLIAGHTLTLDDPLSQRRVDAARGRVLARRRDPLLRAVRLEGRHDCGHGARPQGEQPSRSAARTWRCSRRSRRRRRRRSRTAGCTGSCASRPTSSSGCASSARTSSSR